MTVSIRSAADGGEQSAAFRLRMLAGGLVLGALAFVQEPGLLISDTKLDLVIAPGEFLGRALHLWDPEGAFGQLQNQAYGYLWPMGPFFLLGHEVGLPGWVVQRLWIWAVMLVAFVGFLLLARALGVRSQSAVIVSGFAYALSPRMLSTIGPISIEAWPSAVAPWVLLPLVLGSYRGSTRKAAALAGLAVAMVGGVNAAATMAVLPLGVLWILTREPGRRRRSLLVWWPVMTFLGACWWLVPLFTMAAFSPPFLDYIESAAITTFPTTLFDTVRGTSNWVPYVDPGWRAGNDLVTISYLTLNTGVIALLGALGLARRENPHRQFLVLAVLTGLLMVTFGHTGAVQGWFATEQQQWLDGVLAPLRNVHKFDLVVRLPLVLGMAFLLDVLARSSGGEAGEAVLISGRSLAMRARYGGVLALSVVAVIGATSPAWVGRLAPADPYYDLPDYWREAAGWLAQRDDGSRALLLPASPFGDYVWGEPRDEPIQPLADSPWAVRNLIPLAPPGNIRMLDAVETRLAEGRGSAGLAPFLRRAGIGSLVVRNDLDPSGGTLNPVLVHQALESSPGIYRVASFGPELGGEPALGTGEGRVLVNYGWQARYPAVEIYRVAGAGPAAATSQPPLVVGGPEDLLRLADHGILSDQPTLLGVDADDSPSLDGPVILTDGLRKRQRHFGRLHDSVSATLPRGAPLLGTAVRPDYELSEGDRWMTTAGTSGAAVAASSSMADVVTAGPLRPGRLPYAAVDGDTLTEWVSAAGTDEAGWLEVRPIEARAVREVSITAGESLGDVTQVLRVRTAQGVSDPVELGPGEEVTLTLPAGRTAWVRVEDAGLVPGRQLAIAELSYPGLQVSRFLRMPRLPADWGPPDVILAEAQVEHGTSCITVSGAVRCAPVPTASGEEPSGVHRVMKLPEGAYYEARVGTSARPGEAFDKLIQASQPINASASSTAVRDPMASALAAVDGDPATTWLAALDDITPTLRLDWLGQVRVTGLSVDVARSATARRPTVVSVTYPGGVQKVTLDSSGSADLDPVRTDRLAVTVEEAEAASSLQFDGSTAPLGLGISEVRVDGLDLLPLRLPTTPVRYPCGTGPSLIVNGKTRSTAVVAPPQDLWRGGSVEAEVCGGAGTALESGVNRVRLDSSDAFWGETLVFSRPSVELAPAMDVPVRRTSAVRVQGGIPVDATLAALRENANPGWEAFSADGGELRPVTVDGWQQGWASDGQDQSFDMWFEPDWLYRGGLLVGGAQLLLLVLLCSPFVRAGGPRLARPSSERVLPDSVLITIGGGAVGLLAGWLGLLLFVATVLGLRLLQRLTAEATTVVITAATTVATGWYWVRSLDAVNPWAGDQPVPQYLVVVVLAALFAGLSRAQASP
jgi:arabinofuranan 3-O-arabinosyltransferase